MNVEGQHSAGKEAVPLVALAIVNWNGWIDTRECLESVRELAYPRYLTVLVDNGSSDDSVRRIKAWAEEQKKSGLTLVEYSRLTAAKGGEPDREQDLASAVARDRMVFIRSEENLGPTGGANVAIQYVFNRKQPADYVFLLDNDAQIDARCLTELVQVDREWNAGIVGGVILDKETGKPQLAERTTPLRFFFNPLVRAGLPLSGDQSAAWTTANVHGSAMLIRREVLEKVHASRHQYLLEPLFMDGWEFEFCHFSSLLGYKCVTTRKGFVRHKGERPFRQSMSAKRFYYRTRNNVLLANAFLSIGWWMVFHLYNLPLSVMRAVKVLMYGRPDIARAVVCGLLDGYRGKSGKWKQHRG